MLPGLQHGIWKKKIKNQSKSTCGNQLNMQNTKYDADPSISITAWDFKLMSGWRFLSFFKLQNHKVHFHLLNLIICTLFQILQIHSLWLLSSKSGKT